MNLVPGQRVYSLPGTGRPWGYDMYGSPNEMIEVSPAEMTKAPTNPDRGFPVYWCDCLDGTFSVWPIPRHDFELIFQPGADPQALAAFVDQEIGA